MMGWCFVTKGTLYVGVGPFLRILQESEKDILKQVFVATWAKNAIF
jgi:hypothetical protein